MPSSGLLKAVNDEDKITSNFIKQGSVKLLRKKNKHKL